MRIPQRPAFCRLLRLLRLRRESLAPVLALLASRSSSVSKQELLQAFPAMQWNDVLSDLRLLDDVLFLRPDLTRLTLSESFREELRETLAAEVPRA